MKWVNAVVTGGVLGVLYTPLELVQATLLAFPDAEIRDVRTLEQMAADGILEEIPEEDDDWDPFEDD